MFPSIATALATLHTPVMITPVASPLLLASHCHQVSCHFDASLLRAETASEPGIALPVQMNGAVQKRKAEFIAGRYCANKALTLLGYRFATAGTLSVDIGEHRVPVWPQGFTGSITHTHGFASAIVARCDRVRAIGLDSERWMEPAGAKQVSQQVLTANEGYSAAAHHFGSPPHHLTFVFSAKESLFKCLFPLVRKYFDFHAAVITPLPPDSTHRGNFRFELLADLNSEFCRGFSGHGIYAVDALGVHTAVIL